ncbi:hypothetical protein ACWEVP_42655 [Amycolatopsis sp. NPDC003865]
MIDYGLDLSAVEHDRALPDLVAEGGELDTLVRTPEAFDATPKDPDAAAGAALPRAELLDRWPGSGWRSPGSSARPARRRWPS